MLEAEVLEILHALDAALDAGPAAVSPTGMGKVAVAIPLRGVFGRERSSPIDTVVVREPSRADRVGVANAPVIRPGS